MQTNFLGDKFGILWMAQDSPEVISFLHSTRLLRPEPLTSVTENFG